ncbi:site-specific DNA-methyltransferase [Neomicrococcus lactis]|uniref:Adenine-specific DNA-methyltransferase n=1 Tax=Neomicrococcus lactis TaxID=732241 RepID=A0A7W8YCX3_9MICC|nr:DNA methyltransferase [Neomicrococcus lactis]MBB5599067.1 adenine-specific DNA-methyltransferase [Neomicrococcus lactis]
MTDEIYETPSTTPNFQTELAAQLADLVPEAIADGKVDIEKLEELLDSDAADGSERFGLFWPGKKRALRAAQEPTTATLKPDFENSKDWDTTQNVFIEGDNLEVLKILQKHYHAKIKLIYIDPPYNTGKDFVYPDNYKEGLDTYLEWTRQVNEEGKKVTTNAETEGRYHSNWLNMMYPRLKLARNLLTDDGVIAVSIDENEVAQLRKLMDEVFGESRFLGQLAVQNNPRGRAQDKYFATNHEYVLLYSRSELERGAVSIAKSREQLQAEYGEEDSNGFFRLLGLRNSHREFGRFNRPNLFYPLFVAPDGEVFLETALGREEVLPLWNDGFEGCWTWGAPKAAAERHLLHGRMSGGKMQIFVKDYADGAKRKLKTLLVEKEYSTDAGQRAFSSLFDSSDKLFQAPKSPYLLADLIEASTAEGDMVLDFFAGSGSTAHAAWLLAARGGGERRWIAVQLPEPTPTDSAARAAGYKTIAELSRARIERAGTQMALEADESIDLGFRSYKLADTNFSKWRLSSDVEETVLQQHLLSLRDSATDDATADELLTEILLKQGYSLTENISAAEVGGLDVRLVRDRDGDVAVLAYLNEHVKPTLEQLRALVDEEPTRIIVLEDAFQGDDELKTNLAQLAKSKGIEIWTA